MRINFFPLHPPARKNLLPEVIDVGFEPYIYSSRPTREAASKAFGAADETASLPPPSVIPSGGEKRWVLWGDKADFPICLQLGPGEMRDCWGALQGDRSGGCYTLRLRCGGASFKLFSSPLYLALSLGPLLGYHRWGTNIPPLLLCAP